MKTTVKELNLLDVEDIEQAASNFLGKPVLISQIDCSLVYCIPMDTGEPSGMYLELEVGDDSCDSFDLFYDDERDGHYLNGKQLSLDEPWLPASEVFNFDISAFKSYNSWTDSSD